MYRGDLDGRFALLDAQRTVLSLLLPPVEEQRDVGDLAGTEADDLFVDRLQVGRLLFVVLQTVPHDDAFERLFGRQQADRAEERPFVVGQRAGEAAAEVVVVDGAAQRVVGVERQPQGRGDERTDGGVAHDQRLLRHHVETVAGIGVAAATLAPSVAPRTSIMMSRGRNPLSSTSQMRSTTGGCSAKVETET